MIALSTHAIRLNCSALLPKHREALVAIVENMEASGNIQWTTSTTDADVFLVDPLHLSAQRVLANLPSSSVVIQARVDGAPLQEKNVLSVGLPFDLAAVEAVLARAGAEVVSRQNSQATKVQPPSNDVIVLESDVGGRPKHPFGSLRDLAVHLAATPESGRVHVGALAFDLRFDSRTYCSTDQASELERFRCAQGAPIAIRPAKPDSLRADLPPHRIEGFLWELGLCAGDGDLLAPVDSAEVFGIRRWPPSPAHGIARVASRSPQRCFGGARRRPKSLGPRVSLLPRFTTTSTRVGWSAAWRCKQATRPAAPPSARAPFP